MCIFCATLINHDSFLSIFLLLLCLVCSFAPNFLSSFFWDFFPSHLSVFSPPSLLLTSSPSSSLVDFFFCWYLLLAADAKQFNIRISQCHLKVLRKMVSAWHSLFPFTYSYCFSSLTHFFVAWGWVLFLWSECIFVVLSTFCLLVVAFVRWDV